VRRALVLLAACQASGATDDRQPPPSERFERDMIVRFHMHENFDLLRTIEKLLVRGRLDEARSLARAIAEAPDEPGLGPWAKQAMVVRDRAAALANAKDSAEACRLEARLAEACASCHAEAGVIPEFRSAKRVPPDQPTIEARMARHLWATDRLWGRHRRGSRRVLARRARRPGGGTARRAADHRRAQRVRAAAAAAGRSGQANAAQSTRRTSACVRRDPGDVYRLSRSAARRVRRPVS
jgi:hypothetical protein